MEWLGCGFDENGSAGKGRESDQRTAPGLKRGEVGLIRKDRNINDLEIR